MNLRLAGASHRQVAGTPDSLGVSRWTACGPWPMHYRVAGHGPDVLLLHGLGGSSRYWRKIAGTLARRYRLIMPDLLGFGDSGKPYVAYEPALHCQAIAAVLADAGAPAPFAIVGHSLGAVLGTLMAAQVPRPPATAVLITPPFPTGGGALREEVRRLSPVNRLLLSCVPVTRLTHVGMQAVWPAVCHLRPPGATFAPDVLADYGKYTYHSFTSTLNRCLFDFDLRPALGRLDAVPALVLSASRDRRVPASHGPSLAASLPRATIEHLPSRHHPALSHSEMVTRRLLAWLDQHRASGA
jgi:pimeloyl-ACP methyl ester carboxylesterase